MVATSPAPPLPSTRPVLNRNLAFLATGIVAGIAATSLLGPRLVTTQDLIWHAQRCVWGAYLTRLQFGSMALAFLPNLPIPFALPSCFARGRRDMLSNWMFLQFGKFIVAWGSTLSQFKSNSGVEWVGKSKQTPPALDLVPGKLRFATVDKRSRSG